MFGLFKKTPDDSAYWQAQAEKWCAEATKEAENYKLATDRAAANHRKMVDACRLANKFEDRLNRIAEHFEGQSSGTAKLVVRMARGDC